MRCHHRSMDTVAPRTSPSAPRESSDYVVTDDLAGLPVTDAELDVIEAFLSAELRKLFKEDWEPPQTHAEIAATFQNRGGKR